MSAYELRALETGRRFDEMIRRIERGDPNALDSIGAGSSLDETINNPVTEANDEGW